MTRTASLFLFLLLVTAAAPVFAQSAGDACPTAKQVVRVEGNQGPGLICNGSTLEVYESVDTGPLRKGIGLINPASALDVNGGVRIGADAASCTSAKEGTIRYVAASDSYEFCNGSAWSPFETAGASCADDDTGQCVLAATRSSSDPDFTAANVKCGKNVLNVTGTYGPCSCPSISGFIAHWKLDETSGTSIADSVGSYTGTFSGASDVSPIYSPVSKGIQFDGNNDIVSFGDIAAINGVTKVTLVAWIQRRPGSYYIVVGKETGSHALDIWHNGDGTIEFIVSNGSAANGKVTFNDVLWHHVALVYDGTQTGNAARLKGYVDGVAQTLTFTGTIPATTTTDTTSFDIGEGGGSYGVGSVDDVRLFTTALTATDISNLYNGGAGCE